MRLGKHFSGQYPQSQHLIKKIKMTHQSPLSWYPLPLLPHRDIEQCLASIAPMNLPRMMSQPILKMSSWYDHQRKLQASIRSGKAYLSRKSVVQSLTCMHWTELLHDVWTRNLPNSLPVLINRSRLQPLRIRLRRSPECAERPGGSPAGFHEGQESFTAIVAQSSEGTSLSIAWILRTVETHLWRQE